MQQIIVLPKNLKENIKYLCLAAYWNSLHSAYIYMLRNTKNDIRILWVAIRIRHSFTAHLQK